MHYNTQTTRSSQGIMTNTGLRGEDMTTGMRYTAIGINCIFSKCVLIHNTYITLQTFHVMKLMIFKLPWLVEVWKTTLVNILQLGY